MKRLLHSSHQGTTGGVQQGLQNPPPTALRTSQDLVKLFEDMADTWDIDALIQSIDQMLNELQSKLNPASTSTSGSTSAAATASTSTSTSTSATATATASTSTSTSTSGITDWASGVESAATFLKFFSDHVDKKDVSKLVDKHTKKNNAKGDFFGGTVVHEILENLGRLHWIGGGLTIIAYLLLKIKKISKNKLECLELIKSMFDLAKDMKKLKDQVPEEKLKDAFRFIVEGCITCASQIESKKFFRFLKSEVNAQALQDLRSNINGLFDKLTLTTAIETKHDTTEIKSIVRKTVSDITEIKTGIQTGFTEIQNRFRELETRQPVHLPVRLPDYPEGAVGLEKPLDELKKKIDLQTTEFSSCSVVIYGFGGIGKTTLTTALVATLADDLKDHKYIEVEIKEDTYKNDFKKLQEQILEDLTGGKESLRNCRQGRDCLKEAFKREGQNPVFMFIDNALRSDDLKELLPKDLSGLPHGSRILVTTRNLAETELFQESECGIPCLDYAVKPLGENNALEILRIDPARLHAIRKEVEEILRIAGGIPLVLEIVGALLRNNKFKVENCLQILKDLEYGVDVKKEHLSERLVHSVYKRLEQDTQEAFLDICFFFNGHLRRHVEYIVGAEAVEWLLKASLITSVPFVTNDILKLHHDKDFLYNGEEKLIVHDVIQAKGRQMSVLTRVRGMESWSQAAQDQAQTKIKGVELSRGYEGNWKWMLGSETVDGIFEESQLSHISNSLRIASLGNWEINDRSSKTFTELRCLRCSCIPVNFEGLPCLSFYEGPFVEDFPLPQGLKYLKLKRRASEVESLLESKSIQDIPNSFLEELDLSRYKELWFMLDGRLRFDELKILSLAGWGSTEDQLPPQVFGLTCLKKLNISLCGSLECVPESITNLTGLTHLDLHGCTRLKELCPSFRELKALTHLNLSLCDSLETLPDSFGHLLKLEYLSFRWSVELREYNNRSKL